MNYMETYLLVDIYYDGEEYVAFIWGEPLHYPTLHEVKTRIKDLVQETI
jgi:hypothetical protein